MPPLRTDCKYFSRRLFALCQHAVFLICVCISSFAGAADGVETNFASQNVIDAGATVFAELRVKNTSSRPDTVKINYWLQLNSNFSEPVQPNSVLGFDHAIGCKSTVRVDGKHYGDAMLTDGDALSSFESPWTKGHREAIVDIELDQKRNVKEIQWIAADPNWIWNVDAQSSIDGKTYSAIDSMQRISMHKKWGRHSFAIDKPFTARFLRLRFYNPDGTMNIVRLPKLIEIYDGIENDSVKRPNAGKQIDQGQVSVSLAANETQLVSLSAKSPIEPGSYLLAWEISGQEPTQLKPARPSWQSIFVKPGEAPDKKLTQRFGINSSNIKLANSMSQCGFGWVRFENGKWNMSSDREDHFDFQGGVAPWHVNQDEIYKTYQDLGMKVFPYVFQTPQWATSAGADITKNRAGYPPKKFSDYGEAIYQFAARFGSKAVPADSLQTDDKTSGLDRIDAIELGRPLLGAVCGHDRQLL